MNAKSLEGERGLPLKLGDPAPVVQLDDHDGNVLELSSLWKSKPRVLLFVRHFG